MDSTAEYHLHVQHCLSLLGEIKAETHRKGDAFNSKATEEDVQALAKQVQELETAYDLAKLSERTLKNDGSQADQEKRKAELKEIRIQLKEFQLQWVRPPKDSTLFHDAIAAIQHGKAVQAETTASLHRTLGLLPEIHQVGASIAIRLDQQNRQIAGLIEEQVQIVSILEQSRGVMRRIGRRIVTDKCLWLLIGLVFILIICIILKKNL